MIIRLLLILSLFGLLPAVHAAESANATEVTVPMKAVRVGAHSYFVQGLPGAASTENQGFMSNAGFVITRDGVVVFDTLASPPLAKKMLGLIRKITKQPIKLVIVIGCLVTLLQFARVAIAYIRGGGLGPGQPVD